MVQFGPNLLKMLNAGSGTHQASDAAIAILQGVNQIAADKAAGACDQDRLHGSRVVLFETSVGL
jgi:hypothetical protein